VWSQSISNKAEAHLIAGLEAGRLIGLLHYAGHVASQDLRGSHSSSFRMVSGWLVSGQGQLQASRRKQNVDCISYTVWF